MTSSPVPTWHPVASRTLHHEMEVLASADDFARGDCIAVVETFGHGWYANAMPPLADGTSSMVPGMIRRGNCGENVAEVKAWCERIAGLLPEKPGDRRSEGLQEQRNGGVFGC